MRGLDRGDRTLTADRTCWSTVERQTGAGRHRTSSRILRNHPRKRRKFAEIGVNFHSRAAIWPLTLGPLGYSELTGRVLCVKKTSPWLDRAPSPGRVRADSRVNVTAWPFAPDVATADDIPRIFRGSSRGLSQSTALITYVRTFMSTHFPFKISYTPNSASPSRSFAPRDATALIVAPRNTRRRSTTADTEKTSIVKQKISR